MNEENISNKRSSERKVSIEGRAYLLSQQLSAAFICLIICICLIYYSTRYGVLGILLSILGSLILFFIFGIFIFAGLKLNKQLIEALENDPSNNETEDNN